MPILKIKKNGVWEEVAGASGHTHTTADITDLPNGYAADLVDLKNKVGTTSVASQISTAISKNAYKHPSTHPASMIDGLSAVATSGSYNDLTDIPESVGNVQADWLVEDVDDPAYIKNKPEVAGQVQADWEQDDISSSSYIKNKPTIPEEYTHPETHPVDMIEGLSIVAITGKYSDLVGTPAISERMQADWDQMNEFEPDYIKNKPEIPEAYVHPDTHNVSMIEGLSTVATSGSYNDLINKPSIPEEYIHPDTHPVSMIEGLATVAISGSYNDLADKPTVAGQVQADWNQTDDNQVDFIKNKPTIPSIDGLATEAYVNEKFATVGEAEGKIYKQNEEPTDAPDGSIWVDLDEGTSSGDYIYPTLPKITEEDNGKVLQIVNGKLVYADATSLQVGEKPLETYIAESVDAYIEEALGGVY